MPITTEPSLLPPVEGMVSLLILISLVVLGLLCSRGLLTLFFEIFEEIKKSNKGKK